MLLIRQVGASFATHNEDVSFVYIYRNGILFNFQHLLDVCLEIRCYGYFRFRFQLDGHWLVGGAAAGL